MSRTITPAALSFPRLPDRGQAHFSIFGFKRTIDQNAALGLLFDGLCLDLTRHQF
jgi:hypothetical protein